MPGAGDCPELAVLERVASGVADPGTRAAIEQHVAACDTCSAILEDVVSNLELAGALRVRWPGSPNVSDATVPVRVGSYRILREIGRGGMGVVFEAEQDSPRRRVAVKLLRAVGHADALSERMLRREAAALARLAHPGIATVLDAGQIPDGRPFVAMELVAGTALTRYADRHELGLDERLALFLELCRAIAHAHARGVIHRDVKPSNVLVDDSGRVKVLDFGLAKLLDVDGTAGSVSIETGRIQGTLPYMSPEQVRGEAAGVDVRTDVYSLGVVLYELVVGTQPLDVRDLPLPQAARVICESPPVRPRTVRPELPADLEAIVLRALEKEPDRRYAGASELALDIERLRDGLPVLAIPPSVSYQFRKLIGRHRLASTLAAALLVLIVLAGSSTTLLWFRSERARRDAEADRQTALLALAAEQAAREEATVARRHASEEAERARQRATTSDRVSEFLVGVFEAATPNVSGGETVRARDLLERASESVDRDLEAEPLVRCGIHGAIGRCFAALGDYERAEPHLSAALTLARSLREPEPDEFPRAALHLGRLLTDLGDLAGARALVEEALGAVDSSGTTSLRAALLAQLALQSALEGDRERSVALQREALAIHESLTEPDPLGRARLQAGLAMNLFQLGQTEEALATSRRALDVLRTLGPHTDALDAENDHATMLYRIGDVAGAEEGFRRVLSLREGLGLAEHADTALVWNNLAVILEYQDRYGEAESAHRRAYEIQSGAVGEESPMSAVILSNLARNLYLQKRYDEAEDLGRRALAIQQRTLPGDHPHRAGTREVLGLVAEKRRDFESAAVEFRAALEIREASLPPGDRDTERVRAFLGEALVHAGALDEAEPLLLAAAEALDPGTAATLAARVRCYQALADLYGRRGEDAVAESWLVRKRSALESR